MPSFDEQLAKQLDFEERVAKVDVVPTPSTKEGVEALQRFKRAIYENAEIRKLTYQFVLDLVKILQSGIASKE